MSTNEQPKTETNQETTDNKLEERQKRFGATDETEEINKKIERIKRFGGVVEKENISNKNTTSSETELNQRKERFKEQFEEDEKEKKENEGKVNNSIEGHKGRIKKNFRKRRNNYSFGGNRRRGGYGNRRDRPYPHRRMRGGRRNNSYRK